MGRRGALKWRLFEYAEKESHHLFDDLVQQCVQFLAVKEDKSFFRLKIPKKIYENESLSISAQLYDANYELYNAPEVRLALKIHKVLNTFTYLIRIQINILWS